MLTCASAGGRPVGRGDCRSNSFLAERPGCWAGFRVCFVPVWLPGPFTTFCSELVAASWMGPDHHRGLPELPLAPGRVERGLSQPGGQPARVAPACCCWSATRKRRFSKEPTFATIAQRVYQLRKYAAASRLRLTPRRPIEEHCPLRIPPESMHSFKSQHNGDFVEIGGRDSGGRLAHLPPYFSLCCLSGEFA